MHSSRMRTARSLTDRISWYQAGGVHGMHVPRHAHLPPGHACPPPHMPPPCMPPHHACPPWHACSPTMHAPLAMHTPRTCTPPGHARPALPVNRMTNRCKNITLPQISFADGKNIYKHANVDFLPGNWHYLQNYAHKFVTVDWNVSCVS